MSLWAAQGTAPNEGRRGNPGTLGSALPLYGYAAAARPNTYEAPICQETHYPCKRAFCFFSAFGFLA
jgi:hypothetical protein